MWTKTSCSFFVLFWFLATWKGWWWIWLRTRYNIFAGKTWQLMNVVQTRTVHICVCIASWLGYNIFFGKSAMIPSYRQSSTLQIITFSVALMFKECSVLLDPSIKCFAVKYNSNDMRFHWLMHEICFLVEAQDAPHIACCFAWHLSCSCGPYRL